MKRIIKHTTILLTSFSIIACTSNIVDRSKENASNTSHLKIENVINQKLTYGIAYDIDSNAYKTIKIGKYEWFAQNLQTTKLQDGTPIKEITDNKEWSKSNEPAYCSFNNELATVNGLLYNHKVVLTKKICPQGWEIADDSVWTDLANACKGTDKAAIALKAVNVWDGQEATNESGFSALPSGFRERDGKFHIMGENGLWWSATEHNEDNSMYCYIDKNVSLNHSHIPRTVGLSIRCVKLIK